MHDLLLSRPDNVRGPFGTYVNQDVYHISERLAELDPHLLISAHDQREFQGFTWTYTISELTPWGEKLVFRTDALDARIIERCQYILHVPFERRYAEMEKQEAAWAEKCKQDAMDELYEEMGGPMKQMLYRCGFSDNPVSTPRRNATAMRSRNYAGLKVPRKELILP